ncbi:hypothetical protein C8J56DRAFT_265544 [Mycena floridula]|nr:hypothetical protein C8J56DRAFT_265544 [Mycena floridula]
MSFSVFKALVPWGSVAYNAALIQLLVIIGTCGPSVSPELNYPASPTSLEDFVPTATTDSSAEQDIYKFLIGLAVITALVLVAIFKHEISLVSYPRFSALFAQSSFFENHVKQMFFDCLQGFSSSLGLLSRQTAEKSQKLLVQSRKTVASVVCYGKTLGVADILELAVTGLYLPLILKVTRKFQFPIDRLVKGLAPIFLLEVVVFEISIVFIVVASIIRTWAALDLLNRIIRSVYRLFSASNRLPAPPLRQILLASYPVLYVINYFDGVLLYLPISGWIIVRLKVFPRLYNRGIRLALEMRIRKQRYSPIRLFTIRILLAGSLVLLRFIDALPLALARCTLSIVVALLLEILVAEFCTSGAAQAWFGNLVDMFRKLARLSLLTFIDFIPRDYTSLALATYQWIAVNTCFDLYTFALQVSPNRWQWIVSPTATFGQQVFTVIKAIVTSSWILPAPSGYYELISALTPSTLVHLGDFPLHASAADSLVVS